MFQQKIATDIEQVLEHGGYRVRDVAVVSDSVCRVRLAGGTERYAKLVPEGKEALFETIGDLGTHIGLPESVLVSGNPTVQLLASASGRALSYELPAQTLPVGKLLTDGQIQAGIQRLGRYIGTLHRMTATKTARFNPTKLHHDKYDVLTEDGLDPTLRETLPMETATTIKHLREQFDTIEDASAVVHGDLLLTHVYYSDGDVTLIDFDRTTRTAASVDCISFECALELMVARLPWTRHMTFRSLRNAFYDGYLDVHEMSIDSGAFDFLKLIKFCSLLLYYYTSQKWTFPPSKGTLTKRIDTYLLRRRIASLANRSDI